MEKKTWGREIAASVLIWFICLITYAFSRADIDGQINLIGTLWPFVMTLVAGAFGLKTMKHIKRMGHDQDYPENMVPPENYAS